MGGSGAGLNEEGLPMCQVEHLDGAGRIASTGRLLAPTRLKSSSASPVGVVELPKSHVSIVLNRYILHSSRQVERRFEKAKLLIG